MGLFNYIRRVILLYDLYFDKEKHTKKIWVLNKHLYVFWYIIVVFICLCTMLLSFYYLFFKGETSSEGILGDWLYIGADIFQILISTIFLFVFNDERASAKKREICDNIFLTQFMIWMFFVSILDLIYTGSESALIAGLIEISILYIRPKKLITQTLIICILYFACMSFLWGYDVETNSFVVSVEIINSIFNISALVVAILLFNYIKYSDKIAEFYKTEELNKVSKQLEQQNAELKTAKNEADQASDAKTNFLANMSHEIRTPINSIIGMNEMILREAKEKQITQYALNINIATKSLLNIVNDVLDLSKIEAGKMEICNVDYTLNTFIQEIMSIVSSRIVDKKIEFVVDCNPNLPTVLNGDDVRIAQCITNLLTNAIKYTSEGTITFKIDGFVNGNEANILFSVKDTGIGIKEEDRENLFDKFQRVELEKNRNIEGTGLGLSITCGLLHMMGSELKLDSEYGVGSNFYFNIKQIVVDNTPIGDVKEEEIKNTALDYHALFTAKNAKVLVVDDNEINLVVFTNLLKETKVKITEAISGMQCLELTKKNYYDVIFLDHMMPGLDGVETLHSLRKDTNNKCCKVPVIALTANAISGAREMYLSEGFNDFLAKPIQSGRLEIMLKKWLPKEVIDSDDGKEESNIQLLPKLYGFDWEIARINVSDDKEIFDKLVDFKNKIGVTKKQIIEYLSDIEDEEKLGLYIMEICTLKENANKVGNMLLSQLSKLLEDAVIEDNMELIKTLTPILCDELTKCEEVLKKI